jgi:pimeloyl-ACP methyl ester carboxylesterase
MHFRAAERAVALGGLGQREPGTKCLAHVLAETLRVGFEPLPQEPPMLIVEGERTAELAAVPPESVSLLAAMVPHAEIAVLPGASHLMPLEDLAGVARLVADFARKHPIAPRGS